MVQRVLLSLYYLLSNQVQFFNNYSMSVRWI